jgi:acetoin utilization protein AcuC
MSNTVLVYRGEEIAAYGFGDSHPFGTDRHDVFHSELDKAGLEDFIDYGHPRPALVDELALFHTPDYIDKVSRMSVAGKGWLDDGDTPAVPGTATTSALSSPSPGYTMRRAIVPPDSVFSMIAVLRPNICANSSGSNE